MSDFQEKITRHAKKLESVTYVQGTNPQNRRRKPSGGVDAGLKKDFQTALTRHITGLISSHVWHVLSLHKDE